MKPVRIFRHLACEGPGYLGQMLEERKIDYQVVCIDEGHDVPASLDDISGLIFMGGSMSVNDPLDWISQELELIRKAKQQDIPMLGLCLGGQLISKAFGAEVRRGANGQEIGWHRVSCQPGNTTRSWLGELPAENLAFHWHGETFDIPDGAERLFSSQCYDNQAWVCGNTLALQCHPEMTAAMVREWTELYTDDLEQGGNCNQPAEHITRDLDARISALQPLASTLFNHWIDRLKC